MPTDLSRGPIELVAIEFPGSEFNGQIAPAIAELIDTGIVTVLDLVLVTRELDGSITSVEITDLGEQDRAAFELLRGEAGGLLSEDDVSAAGESLTEGSSAMLIVWENTWARRLVDAIRGSGGRLVAHDRLDAAAIEDALADVAGD